MGTKPVRSPGGQKGSAAREATPAPSQTQDGRSRKWWLQDKYQGTGKPGDYPAVIRIVNAIVAQNNNFQKHSLLNWYRLYQNYHSKGMYPSAYYRPAADGQDNRQTWNIVKSAVDTMHARTTEKEPKPTPITTGGTWSEQKKAKLLDKFLQGLFYETQFASRKAPATTREGYIFGTGAVQAYEDEYGKVAFEQAFREELVVDEIEATHGKPRSLYRCKPYSRDVLRAKFEGNSAAQAIIDRAPTAHVDPGMQEWAEQSDLILAVEAWHLPSGRLKKLGKKASARLKELYKTIRDQQQIIDDEDVEAKAITEAESQVAEAQGEVDEILKKGNDGRHVIATENGILYFGPWRKRDFDFAFTHWSAPLRGLLNGTGIAEELCEIQGQITQVCIQIGEALPFTVPKIMAPKDCEISSEMIDDLAMAIMFYGGPTAPQLLQWEAVPEQLFRYLVLLIKQGYEILGISQMSAAGEKPTDLESGEALRTFDDIQSGRFYTQGKAYEEFFMDAAKLGIRVAKEIADKNDGHYPVNAPYRRRRVEKIDWKDIDLDEDSYVMQVFPTSSLPRTPAGRLAMVNDLMTRGFLDKEDAVRLLNFPDLDAANEVMEAAADFTYWQIERMIEFGEAQMPESYQNLEYTLKHAQAAYLSARTMDVEENRLDMLRNYVEQVKMLAKAQAQALAPPGAQPGIPGGPPTMPAPGEPVAPGPGVGAAPMGAPAGPPG